MWWLLAMVAGAGDESDPPDVDVPSALDGLISSDQPGRRIAEFDDDGGHPTASWILWPITASSYLPSPTERERAYRSTYLGFTAGRRWYKLGANPGYTIEAAFSALFPLGPRTRGRELRLSVVGGPRTKILSLQVGPVLLSNELHFQNGGDLSDAVLAGGRAVLMTDLGPAALFLGIEPVWTLRGHRSPTDWSDTWMIGVGDETSWLAGAVVPIMRHVSLMAGDTLWVSSLGAYHHYLIGVTLR